MKAECKRDQLTGKKIKPDIANESITFSFKAFAIKKLD